MPCRPCRRRDATAVTATTTTVSSVLGTRSPTTAVVCRPGTSVAHLTLVVLSLSLLLLMKRLRKRLLPRRPRLLRVSRSLLLTRKSRHALAINASCESERPLPVLLHEDEKPAPPTWPAGSSSCSQRCSLQSPLVVLQFIQVGDRSGLDALALAWPPRGGMWQPYFSVLAVPWNSCTCSGTKVVCSTGCFCTLYFCSDDRRVFKVRSQEVRNKPGKVRWRKMRVR